MSAWTFRATHSDTGLSRLLWLRFATGCAHEYDLLRRLLRRRGLGGLAAVGLLRERPHTPRRASLSGQAALSRSDLDLVRLSL